MIKINKKLLFTFFLGALTVDSSQSLFTLEINDNSNIVPKISNFDKLKPEEKINSYSIPSNIENKFRNQIIKEIFYSGKKIANLFKTNDSNENNLFVEIESNVQYEENGKYFAKGNVILYLRDIKLEADFVSYDYEKKILKVEGNIKFFKGSQYFEASDMNYDFSSNIGKVNNIYGILDLQLFEKDLNLKNFKDDDYSDENQSLSKNIVFSPSETELLSTNSIEFKNKSYDTFDIDLPKITKWRFKSKEIIINDATFKSKLVFFTNDPFNEPQFVLESKNLSGEIINNNELNLKSRSTFIHLDNIVRFPIGRRRIRDSNSSIRWGLGYDKKNKDGLYGLYNHSPIYLDDFTLNLQSQYLLQRAIEGSTNSFRSKNSKLIEKNVKQDAELFDYFALKSNLVGKLFDYDLDLNATIKSLNLDRIYDSVDANFTLKNRIYSLSKDNYSLKSDLGFYGIHGQEQIHNALGSRLVNNFAKNNNSSQKGISFVIDYGNYYAKDIGKSTFINKNRFGILSSIYTNYEIFDFGDDQEEFVEYKYTPNKIKEKLTFGISLSGALYEYDNEESQSLVSLAFGPTLTLGKHNRNFFSYSSVSLTQDFRDKKGSSPFKFDDFKSESNLRINIEQQIIGALTAGFEGKLNKKGHMYDKKVSLNFKRRAYLVGAYYDQYDDSYGINFKVYNFGYKGKSPKF